MMFLRFVVPGLLLAVWFYGVFYLAPPSPPATGTDFSLDPRFRAAQACTVEQIQAADPIGHDWWLEEENQLDDDGNLSPTVRTRAETGEAEYQFMSALILLSYGGVPGAEERGVDWLRRAAEQSYPMAITELGNLHLSGEYGVTADQALGLSYLLEARRLGEPVAMTALALFAQERSEVYYLQTGEARQDTYVSHLLDAAALCYDESLLLIATEVEQGRSFPANLAEAERLRALVDTVRWD